MVFDRDSISDLARRKMLCANNRDASIYNNDKYWVAFSTLQTLCFRPPLRNPVSPDSMMMDGDGDAREPHLKYESLGGDVAGITSSGDEISCLCLSDKILAIGTAKGRVHVLDYSGNQVRML